MSYILLRSSSQLISQLLNSESRRSDSVTSVHDRHLPIIELLIGRSRLNTKFFIGQNHPGTTQTLGWFLMWVVGMAKVTTQTTRGAALPSTVWLGEGVPPNAHTPIPMAIFDGAELRPLTPLGYQDHLQRSSRLRVIWTPSGRLEGDYAAWIWPDSHILLGQWQSICPTNRQEDRYGINCEEIAGIRREDPQKEILKFCRETEIHRIHVGRS